MEQNIKTFPCKFKFAARNTAAIAEEFWTHDIAYCTYHMIIIRIYEGRRNNKLINCCGIHALAGRWGAAHLRYPLRIHATLHIWYYMRRRSRSRPWNMYHNHGRVMDYWSCMPMGEGRWVMDNGSWDHGPMNRESLGRAACFSVVWYIHI